MRTYENGTPNDDDTSDDDASEYSVSVTDSLYSGDTSSDTSSLSGDEIIEGINLRELPLVNYDEDSDDEDEDSDAEVDADVPVDVPVNEVEEPIDFIDLTYTPPGSPIDLTGDDEDEAAGAGAGAGDQFHITMDQFHVTMDMMLYGFDAPIRPNDPLVPCVICCAEYPQSFWNGFGKCHQCNNSLCISGDCAMARIDRGTCEFCRADVPAEGW
jgi:hypothetical protein